MQDYCSCSSGSEYNSSDDSVARMANIKMIAQTMIAKIKAKIMIVKSMIII